jgi:hypothetical protein
MSAFLVLRPPAESFARMSCLDGSVISRCSVSLRHLTSLAHFDEVRCPQFEPGEDTPPSDPATLWPLDASMLIDENRVLAMGFAV